MSPGSGCGGTVFHRPGTKRMGPFTAVRGCTTKLTKRIRTLSAFLKFVFE